jgi:MinD-like ATPase involved in chromosome partitioning or flagellar assembly
MLLVLLSAKGSPGVTTTALALAATAGVEGQATRPGSVLLVEADPAGGDLECWCGPRGEPGLLRAVTDVRERSDGDRLRSHAVQVVPGVDAILAPTTEVSAGAAWRSSTDGFAEALADLAGVVIVDGGRWLASPPAVLERLVVAADVVGVVCRPTLASVEHARSLVSTMQTTARHVVAVVVGGNRPYGPQEIASALHAQVAGVLPWDPRGLAALVEQGAGRSWLRSPLATAAGSLLRNLGGITARRPERAHG